MFQGEASSVTLPGAMGSFTVLENHASLVSTLVAGNIVFAAADGSSHTHKISGGLADIDNNIVSVCLY